VARSNSSNALAGLWKTEEADHNALDNLGVSRAPLTGPPGDGEIRLSRDHIFRSQIEYLRVYGNTVVAAGNETVVWGGKMPNKGKTEHLRFTGIWMKQSGSWQEIARDANVVLQQ
jgi:hypothetical protein